MITKLSRSANSHGHTSIQHAHTHIHSRGSTNLRYSISSFSRAFDLRIASSVKQKTKKAKKKNASIDKNSGSYECLHIMLFVHYVCIHAKRKQNFQNIIPSSIRVNLGSVNC